MSSITSEVVGPNRRVRLISETVDAVPGLLNDNTAKVAFSMLQDIVQEVRRANGDGEDTEAKRRHAAGIIDVLVNAYPDTTGTWWLEQAKATIDHEGFDFLKAMDGSF